MPQTTVHKLGCPRKLSGEGNTWDVIWALQVNGTVHQVSMKRRLSQKLAVKHDGKTLLDKVFVFSKPYEGYCFVAWVSQGVNFGIYYNTPLMCIRTNADHYDLRVNGIKFMDLPDGCKLRQAKREIALKRSASVPAMGTTGAATLASGDDGPRSGSRSSRNLTAQPESRVVPRHIKKSNTNSTSSSNDTKSGGGRQRRSSNGATLAAKAESTAHLTS